MCAVLHRPTQLYYFVCKVFPFISIRIETDRWSDWFVTTKIMKSGICSTQKTNLLQCNKNVSNCLKFQVYEWINMYCIYLIRCWYVLSFYIRQFFFHKILFLPWELTYLNKCRVIKCAIYFYVSFVAHFSIYMCALLLKRCSIVFVLFCYFVENPTWKT